MLGLWAMVLTGRHGATKELHELFCGLSHEQQRRVFPPEYFGALPQLLEATLDNRLHLHPHTTPAEISNPFTPRRMRRSGTTAHKSFHIKKRSQDHASSAFAHIQAMQRPADERQASREKGGDDGAKI